MICQASEITNFPEPLFDCGSREYLLPIKITIWRNMKCQRATVAKAIEKPKKQKKKNQKFWQHPTRWLSQHYWNLVQKKVNKMKNILTLSIVSIFLSVAAQAEQFNFSKSNDSYVSLSECLYALSKGTRLLKGDGEVFIYNNSVYDMSFNKEQTFDCELIGELVE